MIAASQDERRDIVDLDEPWRRTTGMPEPRYGQLDLADRIAEIRSLLAGLFAKKSSFQLSWREREIFEATAEPMHTQVEVEKPSSLHVKAITNEASDGTRCIELAVEGGEFAAPTVGVDTPLGPLEHLNVGSTAPALVMVSIHPLPETTLGDPDKVASLSVMYACGPSVSWDTVVGHWPVSE